MTGVQTCALPISGSYVYLIKDDNTVTVRPIKLGPQSGDKYAVSGGLQAGDKVVVDGSDKLREGSSVTLPAAGDAKAPAGTAGGPGAPEIPANSADQPREHRKRDKDAQQPPKPQ